MRNKDFGIGSEVFLTEGRCHKSRMNSFVKTLWKPIK